LTLALAGKVSIPFTSIALGPLVDLCWFANCSSLESGQFYTRRTHWFGPKRTGDRLAWGRKGSVKTRLASSCGLRAIPKISSVEVGSFRLI